ncbi:MAG: O-antigen ligase family protein [Verrucomicrobiota bacterium]
MSNPLSLFRALVVFTFCIFLAVFMGYVVASPMNSTALLSYGLIFLAFAFPLLLRWHFLILLFSWNMNAVIFFLPGSPPFWMLMIAVSLVLSLSFYALNRRERFLGNPSVIFPLLFIGAVALATAELRGGINLGSFGGGAAGGKRYIYIFAAIVGYLAFACQSIPLKKAYAYGAAFFLGGASAVIGNLLPLVNPAFYFIFAVFPPEQSGLEALGLVDASSVTRFSGFTLACTATFCSLLACYGIRGIFDLSGPLGFLPFRFRGGFGVNKPWRLILFVLAVAISLFGGYRSSLAVLAITFGIQFFFEGLFRSRLFPILIILSVLSAAIILPLADKLPLSMQRSLSFLPIEVDPIARADAEGSSQWRFTIWRRVLPEVPQYLFLGKGYAISSRDLSIMIGAAGIDTMEIATLAGDYHNGPLSLIMPLGIWGVIGFVWFIIASLKVLSKNYRFSPPSILNLNRFLLVYFIAHVFYFFFIFGSLHSDLAFFAGIVGLSTSLNGGVRRATPYQVAEVERQLVSV